ncbi:MAG: shikimate kinase, partial [Candidatus Eisenbacteria bacterium]
ERSALYREVAETRIATDGRTPEEVARALLEALAAAGPRA